MAHEVYVVHDRDGHANVTKLAPDQMDPDRGALRVEPTPGKGKAQLAQDLLRALRRRPKLAFRWTDAKLDDNAAAGLWCHVHDIRDLVIPRAHTLEIERLLDLIESSSRHTPENGLLSWWLIDASEDGGLARTANALRATTRDAEHMRTEICARQDERDRIRAIRMRPPTTTSHSAVRDAHPALFSCSLTQILPDEKARRPARASKPCARSWDRRRRPRPGKQR